MLKSTINAGGFSDHVGMFEHSKNTINVGKNGGNDRKTERSVEDDWAFAQGFGDDV